MSGQSRSVPSWRDRAICVATRPLEGFCWRELANTATGWVISSRALTFRLWTKEVAVSGAAPRGTTFRLWMVRTECHGWVDSAALAVAADKSRRTRIFWGGAVPTRMPSRLEPSVYGYGPSPAQAVAVGSVTITRQPSSTPLLAIILHWKLSKWRPLRVFDGRRKPQWQHHSRYLVPRIAAACPEEARSRRRCV